MFLLCIRTGRYHRTSPHNDSEGSDDRNILYLEYSYALFLHRFLPRGHVQRGIALLTRERNLGTNEKSRDYGPTRFACLHLDAVCSSVDFRVCSRNLQGNLATVSHVEFICQHADLVPVLNGDLPLLFFDACCTLIPGIMTQIIAY